MTLAQIAVLGGVAALAGLTPRRRTWLLMVASALAVFWMQPATPIRNLDFWLPAGTLALTSLVWAATRQPAGAAERRVDWLGAAVLGGLVLLVAATRYLGPLCCLTPTRPPALPLVAAGLVVVSAAGLAIARGFAACPRLGELFVILLIALFVILKTPAAAQTAAAALRSLSGQTAQLASSFDIRWLGFSYVAFRLLHTLRERIAGRLPSLRLHEFVAYVVFFPAFTAGPIDRVQRFVKDLSNPPDWSGVERLAVGIFKKFVLADGLALMALSADNASQVNSPAWLWVLLYAYSLRLYFDFAGYSDIAIGIGRLAGVHLPENFERPYLKPNLTQFWNSWHMTLAQWFRAYVFNPLTRALRASPRNIPLPLVIFSGQTTTMLLIGLWHGITWNFALWGLWHALGLFVHNRWSEATRGRFAALAERPHLQRLLAVGGALLTFHYVALGWVWFVLPTPADSWRVLMTLFGG